MKAEIRADGLHLSGYVNVPGRKSRPVITPRGKVVEIIEQGTFGRAIARAKKIRLLRDHNAQRELATTENGSLKVEEDSVGLRAETVIKDEETITDAKEGRLKGWSFDMRNVKDSIEERAGEYPIRKINEMDMSEISLVIYKVPVYSSMSIEMRAEEEVDVEYRGMEDHCEAKGEEEKRNKKYLERVKEIKAVRFD